MAALKWQIFANQIMRKTVLSTHQNEWFHQYFSFFQLKMVAQPFTHEDYSFDRAAIWNEKLNWIKWEPSKIMFRSCIYEYERRVWHFVFNLPSLDYCSLCIDVLDHLIYSCKKSIQIKMVSIGIILFEKSNTKLSTQDSWVRK